MSHTRHTGPAASSRTLNKHKCGNSARTFTLVYNYIVKEVGRALVCFSRRIIYQPVPVTRETRSRGIANTDNSYRSWISDPPPPRNKEGELLGGVWGVFARIITHQSKMLRSKESLRIWDVIFGSRRSKFAGRSFKSEFALEVGLVPLWNMFFTFRTQKWTFQHVSWVRMQQTFITLNSDEDIAIWKLNNPNSPNPPDYDRIWVPTSNPCSCESIRIGISQRASEFMWISLLTLSRWWNYLAPPLNTAFFYDVERCESRFE